MSRGLYDARLLFVGVCVFVGAATALPVRAVEVPSASRPPLPQKRALIVAISEYKPGTNWPEIHSTNDVPLMVGALKKQGFPDAGIRILRNEEATRDNILAALKESLFTPSGPGDIIVFHFSGHGQQVRDDGSDELDGYDEALVPYDAPLKESSTYHGEKHLRDDELGRWSQKLRERVGKSGNVVFLLDSCFSGTGLKGTLRGGAPPLGLPKPVSGGPKPSDVATGGFYERGGATVEDPDFAPYIVFSASRENEPDYEMKVKGLDTSAHPLWVGPLSYAVSRSLSAPGLGKSYRDLFHEVQRTMRSEVLNHPQIEGHADVDLFSGNTVQQDTFFEVRSVSGKTVEISGGGLIGLLKGARVELHTAGTREPTPQTLLARGTVVENQPFSAKVELDESAVPQEIAQSWVFVKQYSFGDLRIGVRMEDLGDPGVTQKIVTELSAVKSVSLVTADPDVTIALDPAGPGLLAVTITDGERLLGPLSLTQADLAGQIGNRLQDYARSRYLKKMDLRAEHLDYSFSIVPSQVSDCQDPDHPSAATCTVTELDEKPFHTAENRWRLPLGTAFKIRVRSGDSAAYVALLDLQPDGRINVLWPAKGGLYRMLPGLTRDLPQLYTAEPPQGSDTFLLIASEEPFDAEPFGSKASRQEHPKGDLGPFQMLFDDEELSKGVTPLFKDETVTLFSTLVDLTAPTSGGPR